MHNIPTTSKKRKVDTYETSEFDPAPSGKKKLKGKGESDEGKPEKRRARFRSKCPQNILERVQRVVSQRFFMIDRARVDNDLRETFKVLGSTGNVYTVTIDVVPSCDCPDASKGNHCKHILFVFLKVLGVPMTSTNYYQKALLEQELADIFAKAPSAPNSAANIQLRKAYATATGSTGKTDDVADENSNQGRRIPQEDDDCPICYETMGGPGVAVKTLTFCDACGNALHTECFGQWARTSRDLTCVYCRAKWPTSKTSGDGQATSSEGYLNLGQVAGLSPVRDTSSYYHGPRAGKSSNYGYGRRYY